MQKLRFSIIGSLSLFLFCFAVAPLQAQSLKCDPLPKVDWWSQSHEKVNLTVEKRYNGDWAKYIKRWQGYRDRMQKTFKANSVAVVKSRGIKMKGKVLENHIKQIDQRIRVLNCLKDVQAKPALSAVEKISDEKNTEQVASVSEKNLELEVTAQCSNGSIIFKITNLGSEWPGLSSINIYQTNPRTLLSKRRMKLKNSQQVTFRMSAKKIKKAGEIGIWIEPTWEKRAFKFDAKKNCR